MDPVLGDALRLAALVGLALMILFVLYLVGEPPRTLQRIRASSGDPPQVMHRAGDHLVTREGSLYVVWRKREDGGLVEVDFFGLFSSAQIRCDELEGGQL